MTKKRLFTTEEDWHLATAYANGYAYGRAGLPLRHLWQPDEEERGYEAEELGHYWGEHDLYSFGDLEDKADEPV